MPETSQPNAFYHIQNMIFSFQLYYLLMYAKFQIVSFIQAISIAPLQVHYNSEALPTHYRYCVRVLHWWKTCL